MKKILSMFLCVVMIISMSNMVFAVDFTDVDENYTQYEAIETLETLNIVNGYGNDIYGPDDILTRAQLCTMLVRAIYGDDIHFNTDLIFTDVEINHWARSSIDTAYRNGLMVGYGDGTFGPEDTLTYTQTARTILNALGYGDLEWPAGVNVVAYELGLFDNIDVSDFNTGCTRAHAAQMIYNAFDLELVAEYAGQHFGIDKYFLKDVLGFEETYEYIDGHLYTAYKNLNDKSADLLVTDIRSTFEKTIYPCDANQYKFFDSNRAEKYSFDWSKVDLFVNDVEVNDTAWFVEAESAIGLFNDEDTLIAICITNEGDTWVAPTGKGFDEIPNEIYKDVIKDKKFNEHLSTVTYFIEDNSYVISNKIVCGLVEKRPTTKSIWINDVKYTFNTAHNYIEDDFVVIYFDYNNNIVDHQLMDIEDVYYYNTKNMTLHTWECEHYNNYSEKDYWMTYSEIIHAIDLLDEGNVLYFDRCDDCNAINANREMITIAPTPIIETPETDSGVIEEPETNIPTEEPETETPTEEPETETNMPTEESETNIPTEEPSESETITNPEENVDIVYVTADGWNFYHNETCENVTGNYYIIEDLSTCEKEAHTCLFN